MFWIWRRWADEGCWHTVAGTIVQPEPPNARCVRFSVAPFPAYRFVPGLLPHPTADPRGHSFGHAEPEVSGEARVLVTDWRGCPHFCFGVDLYNFAYWWEAHETWEGLWHCFEEGDPPRHALQGLIQVSAAHLKRHVGQPRGVEALLRRARKHVDQARRAGEVIFGLELERWFAVSVVPFFDRWRGIAVDESGDAARDYPFLAPGS